MFDRAEIALKGLCFALAAVLIWQVLSALSGKDPFGDVTVPVAAVIPEPSLRTVDSNKPVAMATNVSVNPGTGMTTSNLASGNAVVSSTRGSNAVKARSSASKPKAADLPPAVQGRVDKIKESEVFGAIPKPLPMALLGIAGPDAFIRTATGQTGLLREGEELSGVKLLRVGTNRVLIEHEGQRKELTLFSGFGGETLLP